MATLPISTQPICQCCTTNILQPHQLPFTIAMAESCTSSLTMLNYTCPISLLLAARFTSCHPSILNPLSPLNNFVMPAARWVAFIATTVATMKLFSLDNALPSPSYYGTWTPPPLCPNQAHLPKPAINSVIGSFHFNNKPNPTYWSKVAKKQVTPEEQMQPQYIKWDGKDRFGKRDSDSNSANQ